MADKVPRPLRHVIGLASDSVVHASHPVWIDVATEVPDALPHLPAVRAPTRAPSSGPFRPCFSGAGVRRHATCGCGERASSAGCLPLSRHWNRIYSLEAQGDGKRLWRRGLSRPGYTTCHRYNDRQNNHTFCQLSHLQSLPSNFPMTCPVHLVIPVHLPVRPRPGILRKHRLPSSWSCRR